jgi:hypothetical protein
MASPIFLRIKRSMHFFSFFVFLLLFKHKKKWVIKLIFCMKLKIKFIISPFTNHFTAGIIEFQAEITVYCDTCTRETIHFSFFVFLLLFKHKKKWVIKLIFCMKLKIKYINYNIRFLKLLLYDLK